jgi:hypothetical protein
LFNRILLSRFTMLNLQNSHETLSKTLIQIIQSISSAWVAASIMELWEHNLKPVSKLNQMPHLFLASDEFLLEMRNLTTVIEQVKIISKSIRL